MTDRAGARRAASYRPRIDLCRSCKWLLSASTVAGPHGMLRKADSKPGIETYECAACQTCWERVLPSTAFRHEAQFWRIL